MEHTYLHTEDFNVRTRVEGGITRHPGQRHADTWRKALHTRVYMQETALHARGGQCDTGRPGLHSVTGAGDSVTRTWRAVTRVHAWRAVLHMHGQRYTCG